MSWLDEVDAQMEEDAPVLSKGFQLSERSMGNLKGVHKDLVAVVKLAIEITKVDFAVTEGLRSVNRQREMVAKGASQTMNSRHLTGHAVDLVAYLGDRISWEWPLYFKIADAMGSAAHSLDVPLVWGGAWGRLLTDSSDAQLLQGQYLEERRRQGRTPFLDGPHFELCRTRYPA